MRAYRIMSKVMTWQMTLEGANAFRTEMAEHVQGRAEARTLEIVAKRVR